MSRIRTIKPEFFLDEDIASLAPLDRLAFIALWTCADKAGRMEYRPVRLAVQALPYEKSDFRTRLARLEHAGFIIRYKDEHERELIQIRTWEKHQRPHHTEAESVLPPPPVQVHRERTAREPVPTGEIPDGREGKGMEGKGDCSSGDEHRATRFAEFWSAYPRKAGKGRAWNVWGKLGVEERAASLVAVKAFASAWSGATEDRRQFIPHPATWLGQARWQDDPAEWKRQAAGRSQPLTAVKAPPVQIGAHAPTEPTSRDLDEAPPDIQDIARRWSKREPTTDDEDRRLVAWEAGADAH